VGEGWGEGEYTMFTPTLTLKGEGSLLEFSLFVDDESIMNN
jgi:hypothetical protein